jgi:hypothetical protein
MVSKQLSRQMISDNMGYPWRADNSKSKRELGIEYHPVSDAAAEMFQQLIDTGVLEELDFSNRTVPRRYRDANTLAPRRPGLQFAGVIP